jgi:hypothetical protein
MADSGRTSNARPAGAFINREVEFAAHLRDPDTFPPPTDVEDRRMQIYRDLFFNNICGFLAGGFQRLHACMGDAAWRELIRDFYRDHASHTPLFTKLYKEFITYLHEERGPEPQDPPFLVDLAHFEWVRLDLLLAPDAQPNADVDADGDLLEEQPVFSPLARALCYRFPVDEIRRGRQPTVPAAAPIHFLAYRNADDEVKFVKLNVVSARLFELLDSRAELSGRAALNIIVDELRHPQPETVIEGGHAILSKWREMGVVTGTGSRT